MRRRVFIGIFIALLVVTRAGSLWLALNPEHYKGETGVAGDPGFYQSWARQVMREDLAPYSQVRIEYPPGVLPFIVLPQVGLSDDGDGYAARFASLMLLLDVIVVVRLVALARRRGSWWGPWLWLLGVPLLGPISYMRLDMIPAAATVLALERADAGRWSASGAWLSFGALAKIYPILLMPIALLRSPAKRKFLFGALVVGGLSLLGFVGSLDDLVSSVLGYHNQRGIQFESSWSAGLLSAAKSGYPISIDYSFGALHVTSAVSPLLKSLSNLASAAVVLLGAIVALRRVEEGNIEGIAGTMLAVLMGLLAVGSVFSPQFMLWVLALGAVAVSFKGSRFLVPSLILAPAALMSQLIYPFYYISLMLLKSQTISLLAARNALVAGGSAAAFVALFQKNPDRADPEEVGNVNEEGSKEPLAVGEDDDPDDGERS